MSVIMKSIKPRTCADIMNLIQSILVIKSKREATAIQKLIDEYGYADIYVYCTKDNYSQLCYFDDYGYKNTMVNHIHNLPILNGKVIFKFSCYIVEEIESRKYSVYKFPYTGSLDDYNLLIESCLTIKELDDYLGYDKKGYAIHIGDLEIFDEPRELSEFKHIVIKQNYDNCGCKTYKEYFKEPLTKAPQNFCYVEVE